MPPALPQGMHEVAYTGGLARPLIVPESALSGLSAAKLAEFVAHNYTAPRITLAGAGVSQADLVGLAQPLLEFLPKAAPEPQPASTYVGGDFRCARGVYLLQDVVGTPSCSPLDFCPGAPSVDNFMLFREILGSALILFHASKRQSLAGELLNCKLIPEWI